MNIIEDFNMTCCILEEDNSNFVNFINKQKKSKIHKIQKFIKNLSKDMKYKIIFTKQKINYRFRSL